MVELMGQIYIVIAKYLPVKYVRRIEAKQAAIEISQQNGIKIL